MVQYFPVITGSLTVNGNLSVTGTTTVSASNSVSSSYAYTASSAVSSSYAYTASSAVNSFSASKAVSSSYADTASFSNNFTVLGNLTVYGTQSIQYITSSQLNVSSNVINVNVGTPGVRFGGLSVYDSGSQAGATGSLFWDSQNNRWIYQQETGSTYTGGMLISGPRNSGGLGNEQGTTSCMLLVGQGGDHLTSSLVYHDSARTCFYGTSLFISASGNVGIGTSNPAKKLHISGSCNNSGISFDVDSGATVVIRGNTTANFDINNEGSGGCVRLYGSAIQFRTNVADPAVVINNAGYVGIGCTAPSGVLTVGGDNNQIHVRGGYYASIYGFSGDQQVFGIYGNCNATYFNARGASGLYLGGYTSCDHIFLNTNGITCFSNTVCVPSLRVQSAFADLTICGSNTTSPHLGGTFSITTNQDGLGRTIIGNGYVGRAIYLESNGQTVFNCGTKFGNGSCCLNHYQEGKWCIYACGSSSGAGPVGEGTYTRIGRLITASFLINSQTFPTYSGGLRLSLPFTAGNGSGLGGNMSWNAGGVYFYPFSAWCSGTNFTGVDALVFNSTNYAQLSIANVNGDRQGAVSSTTTSTSGASGLYLRFTITYEASQ